MLTKLQAAVLDFTDAFIETNGYAPSYQQIADVTGNASKSRMFHVVRALEERGFVRVIRGGRARGIEVLKRLDGSEPALRHVGPRARDAALSGLALAGFSPELAEIALQALDRVGVRLGMAARAGR